MISTQGKSSIFNGRKCSKCEAINPDDALQCNCGYVLQPDLFQKSIFPEQSEVVPIEETKLLRGLLGGVLAAITGGWLWSQMIIGTGKQFVIIALALGWLCGFAVVRFTSGQKTRSLQIIAVVSSFLSLAVGKYFLFVHALKVSVEKDYGKEALNSMSLLSDRIVQLFLDNIVNLVDRYDFLWILLAIIPALRITQPSK